MTLELPATPVLRVAVVRKIGDEQPVVMHGHTARTSNSNFPAV